MIAMTPLEQAVVAFTRAPRSNEAIDRQQRVDDAVALAETGAFSIANIILITRLPRTFCYQLLAGTNVNKRGGSLNVEHLEMILDIANQWARYGGVDRALVRTVIEGGTSPRMLMRLTGIHYNTFYRWIKEFKRQPGVDSESPIPAD